jgi:hypothetical protein
MPRFDIRVVTNRSEKGGGILRTLGHAPTMFQSLLEAFSYEQDLARQILRKHSIDCSEEWVNLENVISCLHYIEEKVGDATIRQIGRNISRYACVKQSHMDFFEFIKSNLNLLYMKHHQRAGSGFSISVEKEGVLIEFKNNPYPFHFNEGLIEGFSLQLLQPCIINNYRRDNRVLVTLP